MQTLSLQQAKQRECTTKLNAIITVMSLTTLSFDQKLVQANNNKNIKALHYWPFVRWIQTSGFLSQRRSYAKSVSKYWCHHDNLRNMQLKFTGLSFV